MKRSLRIAGIAAIPLLLAATPAFAHEKWFYEGPRQPLRWDLFFRPGPLTATAVALGATETHRDSAPFGAWIDLRTPGGAAFGIFQTTDEQGEN